MKEKLIQAFNALHIEGMGEITKLHQGKGAFVNLDFTLPSGQSVKFWENEKTYYINQVEKRGSTRCYGLTADEHYLLVCEYGDGGTDAEIVIFKRWN